MIKINNEKLEVNKFPDGTFRLNYLTDTEGYKIEWIYEDDSEAMLLYYLVNHIRENVYDSIIGLNMKYCSNARMDRTQQDEEVFTLKWFSKFINSMKFDSVTIEDPHSNVVPALLDNVHVTYDFQNAVEEEMKKDANNTVLFFPDNGAASKYTRFYTHPYAYGLKHRDWKTGEIQGLEVVTNGLDMKNKKVIIVDDISSYGTTFLYSAKALKELGVGDITLCVTHCENSVLDGEMIKSDLISKIITTDSIFTGEHDKIEVKRWYRGEKNEEN